MNLKKKDKLEQEIDKLKQEIDNLKNNVDGPSAPLLCENNIIEIYDIYIIEK